MSLIFRRLFLLVTIVLLLSGCARKTHTLKFDKDEVSLIPLCSFPQVLAKTDLVKVKVKTKNSNKFSEVIKVKGFEYVTIASGHSNEVMKIPFSEIEEIVRTTQIKREKNKVHYQGTTSQYIGETLIYLPFVPIGLVGAPIHWALGGKTKSQEDTDDYLKASLVYGGMTKKELITYVGQPEEKYHCIPKWQPTPYDVWIYPSNQIISSRGHIRIYSGPDSDTVIVSLNSFPGYDDCTLLTKANPKDNQENHSIIRKSK